MPRKPRPDVFDKFRDAGRTVARSMVTCGFELETQESEGQTYKNRDIDDDEYDDDAIEHDVQAELDDAVNDVLAFLFNIRVEHLPTKLVDMTYVERQAWLRENEITTLQGLADAGHMSQRYVEETRDHMYERLRSHVDYDNYRTDSGCSLQNRVHEKVEVGDDGSVQGFEFRTVGGLSYATFKKAADSVFKLDHEIDTECSFHVHVGVKGLKHRYGERVQAAMVEYLMENIARVPAGVRERWRDVRKNQYIRGLYVSRAKYSFIHMHSQGTWEFRCFGNVDNARDGMRCLDLAIEALQHAYAVLSGQAPLIQDAYDLDSGDLDDYSFQAIETGRKFSTVVRAAKIQRAA